MPANNEDGAWSEDEGTDECDVCIEGGLEAASTLEGESGTAVQPVHEDVHDEGLEYTVGEQVRRECPLRIAALFVALLRLLVIHYNEGGVEKVQIVEPAPPVAQTGVQRDCFESIYK
ncbi:Uncharacterized protein Fot_09193 [Forsythia ovata]|uniref:Uncharacterized protein n=1 Tax=Forsythia ovata TaxID=205694 RepID=A0ABD1WDA9_9LAMI